jgi:predicted amidohydrolase YtcJ
VKRCLAALAALGLAGLAPARADTLIDNVNGVTFDAEGRVERFAAMVIGEDGRVVRLLAAGDEKPARIDRRVDGGGRVALPGFIDSHLRLIDLGFAALRLDLTDTRSLREVQFKLGAFAAAHPEQGWIVGSGWDHSGWDRPKLPEAIDLDAVTGDRPVWLISADGRYGWANAPALRAAGVTAESPDPEGGSIVRLDESGEPSGILVAAARRLVDQAVPPPAGADRDLALGRAEDLLLARGITAVSDMGTTAADWIAYRRAADADRLSVRIMAYADSIETAELIGGPGPTPWLYDDRLRLNGVLLRIDGDIGSRDALLKAPYADAPETSGTGLIGAADLAGALRQAAARNFQVAAAAHGDAAVSRLLDAAEALPEVPGERRWRIEHGSVIDPADAERLVDARLALTAIPAPVPAERRVTEARLGAERLDRVFAWKELNEAGTVLAFGSAAPAHDPAPFAAIVAAVTRSGPDGEPFGGWQPAQRLTREAALAAHTAGAARTGFAEARFGRLAPGQWADFILIERDPLLATPDELRAIRVVETWVGGKKVFQAPELPLSIPRLPEGEEGR